MKEYQILFLIFNYFYNFYKILFESGDVARTVIKNLDVSKNDLNKLSDFLILYENKPIRLESFKSQFNKLHVLSEKIPLLFEIQGSLIKISEEGIKLSEKIYRYNRIGRKFPSELNILHNNKEIRYVLEN